MKQTFLSKHNSREAIFWNSRISFEFLLSEEYKVHNDKNIFFYFKICLKK